MTLRGLNDNDARAPGGVGYPQLVIVVAALADLAFTGAVAVHVAFHDVSGWTVALIIASALVFVVATIVALAAKRRSVVIVAVAFVALAGSGAAVAAVDGGLRYRAAREQGGGARVGVPVAEADRAHNRRATGAMLAGISAGLAAVTALPLAAYLAYGVSRAGRAP